MHLVSRSQLTSADFGQLVHTAPRPAPLKRELKGDNTNCWAGCESNSNTPIALLTEQQDLSGACPPSHSPSPDQSAEWERA
uniref:Uncharacterized protein n=1 Tax=Ditylenchus dipsaci TaxID=166011 RepID=A0A915CYD9_9BILA